MAESTDRRRLGDVAASGRFSAGRLLRVALVLGALLFVLGAIGLSLFFSSETFANMMDKRMRPRLKDRGITFKDFEISATGEITLRDLRIELPNGEVILVQTLKGRTDYASVLRGEAKATFDVSEIARQYFRKTRRGIQLDDASKILYVSLATSLSNPGRDVRGEVHLKGVRMNLTPPGKASFPLQFRDGKLNLIGQVLSSEGLHFTLPGMAALSGGDDDLEMRFDGNIRSLFGDPEFVASKVQTRIRTEPMWARTLGLLNIEEVQRKIRWFGPLDIQANLEGPIFSPKIQGAVDTTELHLRMRGEFRQIDIRFGRLKGPIEFLGDGAWVTDLKGSDIRGEYFRLKEADLKHLKMRAEAFQAKAVHRGRVLSLESVGFAAYGGKAIGKLTWDLNDRNIRLGPGRTGDTAYSYRLGFQDMRLGEFMEAITGLAEPFRGRFSGLLEGKGRTLMLERMNGEGNMVVRGLEVGTLPRLDRLREVLGPATESLAGARLGDLQTGWVFRGGQLRLPQFEVRGPDGSLSGGLHYDILRLDIGGNARLELFPGFLAKNPALRARVGERPALSAALGGRVVEPMIQYQLSGGP